MLHINQEAHGNNWALLYIAPSGTEFRYNSSTLYDTTSLKCYYEGTTTESTMLVYVSNDMTGRGMDPTTHNIDYWYKIGNTPWTATGFYFNSSNYINSWYFIIFACLYTINCCLFNFKEFKEH